MLRAVPVLPFLAVLYTAQDEVQHEETFQHLVNKP